MTRTKELSSGVKSKNDSLKCNARFQINFLNIAKYNATFTKELKHMTDPYYMSLIYWTYTDKSNDKF